MSHPRRERRVHHCYSLLAVIQTIPILIVDVAGAFVYTERRVYICTTQRSLPPCPPCYLYALFLPSFGGLLFFYHVRHHLVLLLNCFLAYKLPALPPNLYINHILRSCVQILLSWSHLVSDPSVVVTGGAFGVLKNRAETSPQRLVQLVR